MADESDKFKGSALHIEALDVDFTKWKHTVYEGKPRTDADGPTIRSCWECNAAHEHLKQSRWLLCFACGQEFREGVKQ